MPLLVGRVVDRDLRALAGGLVVRGLVGHLDGQTVPAALGVARGHVAAVADRARSTDGEVRAVTPGLVGRDAVSAERAQLDGARVRVVEVAAEVLRRATR